MSLFLRILQKVYGENRFFFPQKLEPGVICLLAIGKQNNIMDQRQEIQSSCVEQVFDKINK